MRTHTEIEPAEVEQSRVMREAFIAIEKAVWWEVDNESPRANGPDRLMATALISKVWEQLEEAE